MNVSDMVPFGGVKKCTKCKKMLTMISFAQDRHTKDGMYPSCRACNGHTQPPNAGPGGRLSPADQLQLYKYGCLTGSTCAICGDSSKRMVRDHCHTTGRTRSTLCDGCNALVGWLETRAHLLEDAHEYLRRWELST